MNETRRFGFRVLAGLLGFGVVATAVVVVPTAAVAAPSTTTQTFSYTGSTQTFTVPANIYSLTINATGAEGGLGGRDSQGEPIPGGYKGNVNGTIAVTPGQVLTISVGGGGTRGNSSTASQSRAAAGVSPLSGYAGGQGGMPGNQGSSGGGGGGGAATVIKVGTTTTIVAGGAGGGGGSGQWTPLVGRQAEASHKARTDTTSGVGQNGYDVMSICSGNCDGGGSGAGGGGAQGGAQGTVEFGTGTYTEWLGYGGYPGANSTANLSGLSASYVFFSGNSGAGSASISYTTGSADAPTNVIGVTENGRVPLSWTAPTNTGGAEISDYIVEYAVSGTSNWTVFADGTSTDTSATVTGLTNGTAYIFRVSAVNSFGTGAPSASSDAITPSGVPLAPVVSAVVNGDSSASLTFTQPSSGAAPTRYEYQLDNGSWLPASGTTSPLTISGLTNGQTYSVVLRAINVIGEGSASTSVEAKPIAKPGAPTITSATPGVRSASIDFEAGFGGGGSITGYQYRVNSGSWTDAASSTSPLTVSGLADGTTYSIELRAVNSAGNGATSNSVVITTPGTPAAPTLAPLVVGDRALTLVFTSGDSRGSAVTAYEYQLASGGDWVRAGSSSPIVVEGLTNGQSYDVSVRAVNAVGAGAASSVRTATPATTPGAPSIVGDTVAGSDARLSAAFTAPSSNGGSAITGYEYSTDGGATWRPRESGTTESPLVITTLSSDGTTPLTNGTTYYVEVRAVNEIGAGTASGVAAGIARTKPSTPTISSIAPSDSALRVTFEPASNGGSPITGYEYRVDSGAWTSTGSLSTVFDITGLTNGTAYGISLRAVNAEGDSSAATSTGTPVALPGQPVIVSSLPTDRTLTLTVETATTGGSSITGYEYSTDGGATWRATAAHSSPLAISTLSSDGSTRLVNGESYSVLVRALNAAGTGAASDPRVLSPRAVPAQPTTVVTAQDAAASVSFSVADDGGSPITAIQYRLTESGDAGAWTSTGSLSSPFVVSGLTNGSVYSVEVRALNVSGSSAVSVARTVTPRTIPGAPVDVAVTSANASAAVTWSAPESNGGSAITSYVATAYATASSSTAIRTGTSNTTAVTISGLTNLTTYYVSVVALNEAGTSVASSPRVAVIPMAKPSAPTIGTITPANTYLSVPFTAGAAGSASITSYQYQLNGGEWRTASGTTSPITISSLVNGTSYSVALRAVSAAGAGDASVAKTATPYTLPDAPDSSKIIAEPGSGVANVSWTAPSSNGSTITAYTVVAWSALTQGSQLRTCTTTGATACQITGLTNGTTYYITIDATNAAGTSTRSTPRVPVVYTGAPGSVTGVTGTSGDASVSLSWTAGTTGASATTDYTVWYKATGSSSYTRFNDGTSTATTATVTGLTNGTPYTFIVYAVNSNGTSFASAASSAVTPIGPGVAPTFSSVTRGANGYTFQIANYSDVSTYTLSADNGASVSRMGSTVTVSGLADGASSTVSVTVDRVGYTTASADRSGTALDAGVAPIAGETTKIEHGFTFEIENYADDHTIYTLSGATATRDGAIVTVTGLDDDETATVTVTATLAGSKDAHTDVQGTSLPRVANPDLDFEKATADGFLVTIDGYDSNADYEVTVTAGAVSRDGKHITVTGLEPGEQSKVTVTATRDGYLPDSDSTTKRALYTGASPEIGSGYSTTDGFTLELLNPSGDYTYSVSVDHGSVSLSGTTITVTGLSLGQSALVTVTADRSGYTDGVATASASSLANGTAAENDVPVATTDGFTFEITNFDADTTYTVTVSAGQVALSGSTVTVTGLGVGDAATVTIGTAKEGAVDATSDVTAHSIRTGTAPVLSAATTRANGFTVEITNYDADVNYVITSSNGGTISLDSGTITVTGLGHSVTSTLTVTATQTGYTDAQATVDGTSAEAPAPTPTPTPTATTTPTPTPTPTKTPTPTPTKAPTDDKGDNEGDDDNDATTDDDADDATDTSGSAGSTSNGTSTTATGTTRTAPEVAERKPGTGAVVVGGRARTSSLTHSASGTVLTSGGMSLVIDVAGRGRARSPFTETMLTVTTNETLHLTIEGFKPDTELEVWGFSKARLLNTAVVSESGTTDTQFRIPANMELGEHTLVVSGMSAAGVETTMSVGFIVTAPAAAEVLAPQPAPFPWWLAAIVALGLLVLLIAMGIRGMRRAGY